MSYDKAAFMNKPKGDMRMLRIVDAKGKTKRESMVPADEVDFWYEFLKDSEKDSRVELVNPDGTLAPITRPYIDPTKVWEINYYA